jgi:hypothetical protein
MTRDIHAGRIQRSDGGAAQEPQCAFDIVAQYLQCASDPCLTRRAQPVGIRAANQHGSGPQAERFHNVAATPHATVHEHFHLLVYRIHHFGQRPK